MNKIFVAIIGLVTIYSFSEAMSPQRIDLPGTRTLIITNNTSHVYNYSAPIWSNYGYTAHNEGQITANQSAEIALNPVAESFVTIAQEGQSTPHFIAQLNIENNQATALFQEIRVIIPAVQAETKLISSDSLSIDSLNFPIDLNVHLILEGSSLENSQIILKSKKLN